MRLNRALGRKGAVFKDRFFSNILTTPSEVARALLYIAQNPVKAGYSRKPEDWEASAVRDFLFGSLKETVWSFYGHAFRVLGFFTNPRKALKDILDGKTKPVRPGRARQNRLPFKRGLPKLKTA